MAPPPHLNERVSPDPSRSPGPVENDEYLIREVCDPQHIDEEGNVVESAISPKNLLSECLSVHRRQYTSIDFIKQAVQNRCNGTNRQDWKEEVALFKAEGVRTIHDKGKQVFVVVDTPHEDHIGHASIYVNSPEDGNRGRAYARKVRKHLLPLLQQRMSVDEAFHSTLTNSK